MSTSLMIGVPAYAQTVNCKKTSTEVERAICEDETLRELDTAFSIEVKDSVPDVRPEQRVDFLFAERQWLAARDTPCTLLMGQTLPECLAAFYREGIAYLKDMKSTDAITGWIPLENTDDSGELLIDVTSIRSWKRGERYAFQVRLIPKPHTVDEQTKKTVLFEQMEDRFNCSEGTASKLKLGMVLEDGTGREIWPWGHAAPWRLVTANTALSTEMKFVCGLQLTSDSSTAANLGEERIFGTWQVQDRARGKIAGPIVISKAQITLTFKDKRTCAVNYQLASRSETSTFPGGPVPGDKPDGAYTTFVLELGPHPCAPGLGDLTISFPAGHMDFAHFFAFGGQGYGTMRRILPKEN